MYLGSIIGNNDICLESILDDDGVFYDPERDRKTVVEEWIKDNYEFTGKLIIPDDFVVNCNFPIFVKNKHITSLTCGLFQWGTVYSFYCMDCDKLKNLEGAPKKTTDDFICKGCESLESLEGAPEKVDGNFVCHLCNKLTNLIGSPKIVKECFACAYCDNLKSLEGISGIIKGGISCTNCKSLRDITHIKKVGDNIIIQNCPNITRSTPEIDKKIRIYNEG